jgi:hypothetical protein
MSFASALNVLRPALPYYVALTKYGLLRVTKDCFEFDPNPAAPPLALEMARAVFTLGASSCTESYVMSRTLAEGPKVFAFSDALTCEALENFDLSVSAEDYLQPFPSVVVELPAATPGGGSCRSGRAVTPRTWVRAAGDAPDLAPGLDPALEARPGLVAGGDVGEGQPGLGRQGHAGHDGGGGGAGRRPEQAGAERVPAGDGLLRALPWAGEPAHYERLKRHAKLARKRGREQQEKADLEVRLVPVWYAFAQEVTLYRREEGEVRTEGHGGAVWTVSPHWRRGHWRWQPRGAGRQERRVAIPSVLVNGHLFLGTPADTVATYRVRG